MVFFLRCGFFSFSYTVRDPLYCKIIIVATHSSSLYLVLPIRSSLYPFMVSQFITSTISGTFLGHDTLSLLIQPVLFEFGLISKRSNSEKTQRLKLGEISIFQHASLRAIFKKSQVTFFFPRRACNKPLKE